MMEKQTKFIIFIILIIVIIGGIGLYFGFKTENPGKLDNFAKCINESGAKFYGTFWCPHCQDQKKEFGSSMKYLPYIECSTPDGQSQLDICKDEKIEGYPTWVFADGSRQSGKLPLETLRDKTQCPLPQ
jgi:hypothetical protein